MLSLQTAKVRKKITSTQTSKRKHKLTDALIFEKKKKSSLIKRIMSYIVGKQNYKCMVHIDG